MREAAQTTAANVPLQIGDQVLLMSPLTDRDIAELDQWIQWKYLQNVRNSFQPDDSIDVIMRDTRIAQETSLSLTWLSGQGARIATTLAGMSRIVWQSCKRNHPDLTEDKIRALMIDAASVDAATEAFRKANPPVVSQPGNADAVSVA